MQLEGGCRGGLSERETEEVPPPLPVILLEAGYERLELPRGGSGAPRRYRLSVTKKGGVEESGLTGSLRRGDGCRWVLEGLVVGVADEEIPQSVTLAVHPVRYGE